MKINLLFSRVQ